MKQLRKEKLSKINKNSFLDNIFKRGYQKKRQKYLIKISIILWLQKLFSGDIGKV